MPNGFGSRDLGDLLEQLKAGSERSYESIARKTNLSKSTVHRYCTGAAVPREFGVLERIALVCGAGRDDLVRLHRLWLRASASRHDTADQEEEYVAHPEPTAAGRIPVWRSRRTRALVGGVLALYLVLVSSSNGGQPPADSGHASPQWVSGPAWLLPASPVPSTLFGVTINSSTGAMPAFRIGSVRFWDGGTRWSELERERNEFDWTALDRLVGGAESQGLPPLFVFGGTPKWASPAGPAGPYPDGTPAPPDDLADWDAFVRALVQRYHGRIESYELWVLGNDRRFYAGSVEKLVEMTRRASGIIHSVDPKATVVCPGMGQLWDHDGIAFFHRFAELGGYNYCDVAGVKLFQKSAADPPETMLELTTTIDDTLHQAGIQPRVWSTGTTYTITLQAPLDDTRARDYAVRYYLIGLYARKVNVERMYFYNWGGTKIPIVLQAVGGTPTKAALAIEQLERWLNHAQSRSCGHGIPANLPGNVWECQFTITEPTRTYDATIRWTATGAATTAAPPRIQAIRHLDGTTTPTQPGDPITITEEPILLESGRP